jgi:hypothetical protein
MRDPNRKGRLCHHCGQEREDGVSDAQNTMTGQPQLKFGLAEIDGKPYLVPQDGERLTVPTTAGRVYNGTDEVKMASGS